MSPINAMTNVVQGRNKSIAVICSSILADSSGNYHCILEYKPDAIYMLYYAILLMSYDSFRNVFYFQNKQNIK